MKLKPPQLMLLILVAGILASCGLNNAMAQSEPRTDELDIRIDNDGLFYVWPNGTKYDNALSPPPLAVVDNLTYSLTGDINSSILVERDYIVLNGSGHTVNVSNKDGVDLSNRKNVTVCNFDLKSLKGGFGVKLLNSTDSMIVENTISGFYTGINLVSSHYNIVAHNRINNSSYCGIALKSCIDDKIMENVIEGNDHASFLVYMEKSVGCEMRRNILENNVNVGLRVYSKSQTNSFFGNTIINNSIGIWINGSGSSVFLHNNLIDNLIQASIDNSNCTWNDGFEGNHWSGYRGKDGNSDAVGDDPYNIDNIMRDDRPLMAESQDTDLQIDGIDYEITVVCNSTISNRKNELSFQLPNLEGSFFCRVCLPKNLIDPPFVITEGPPYSRGDLMTSNPLDYKIVEENQTHTWTYFVGRGSSGLTIAISAMSGSPPLWYQSWFWAVCISTAITVATIGVYAQQKRTKEGYRRELESLRLTSHLEMARALVHEDIKRCKDDLSDFEKKHKVHVRNPEENLDGILKRAGIVEKEERNLMNHE